MAIVGVIYPQACCPPFLPASLSFALAYFPFVRTYLREVSSVRAVNGKHSFCLFENENDYFIPVLNHQYLILGCQLLFLSNGRASSHGLWVSLC